MRRNEADVASQSSSLCLTDDRDRCEYESEIAVAMAASCVCVCVTDDDDFMTCQIRLLFSSLKEPFLTSFRRDRSLSSPSLLISPGIMPSWRGREEVGGYSSMTKFKRRIRGRRKKRVSVFLALHCMTTTSCCTIHLVVLPAAPRCDARLARIAFSKA